MNDNIQVIKGGNFGDCWYWDYRVWFVYKGQKFTYLGIGSGSGWIPCSDHIGRGFCTMLSERCLDMEEDEWGINRIDSESVIPEIKLRQLAEKLIASGEDTLDIYD